MSVLKEEKPVLEINKIELRNTDKSENEIILEK